jgi:hypothetical protein
VAATDNVVVVNVATDEIENEDGNLLFAAVTTALQM